ncbi:lytic polysaccharide monooxygenase [Streptomyces sp. SID3212]|uniref:lytic polysaccharide monooxygenase auxiliary activity family 9 protein n=1 Tax=unclassified Streptomyces TaxID=2593676 RepID=UPI00136E200E|nr:lytic polysaccharide monooxygenase [Streptomyces sp. SID3212]MYV55834.1 chitin-binding protein [Streptomyces sp. SID3212]
MRKKIGAAVVGLAIAGVSFVGTGSASSHGYTDQPLSRQKLCANGTVSNCGNIQWEPQSAEGPKGFPAAGPPDGQLCSAGLSQFNQLNDQRNGAWPTTKVTSGANYNFRWQFTASHATTDFKYYITKQGWNSNAPLTRAALETQPFLTVPYNNARPPFTLSHSGKLPSRTGRHMILGVWTISDTANAFYSCSDVQF